MEGLQYLLTSLHIENKSLSDSFTKYTIPTNGGNQDYVSLSFQSAIRCLQMVEKIEKAFDAHLFISAQAISLKPYIVLPPKLEKVYKKIIKKVQLPYSDNELIQNCVDALTTERTSLFSKDENYSMLYGEA